MNTQHSRALHLQVVADVICPWCFIGKRSLDQALDVLAGQGIEVDVEWLPYQLNPTLPEQGMDRKAFRTQRFGWENSLAMDARAVEAGNKVGAEFRYDRQSRTPNTVAAHSLVRLARAEGGAVLQDGVIDALFVAYFTDGADIGDHAVLERIAVEAGMRPGAVSRALEHRSDVLRFEGSVRATGLNSVPSYIVDGQLLFSGSTSVDGYVRALSDAAKRAA